MVIIWILGLLSFSSPSYAQATPVDFYGDTVHLPLKNITQVAFTATLSDESIKEFYQAMQKAGMKPVTEALLQYKKEQKADDWLFYQLIRKTAQLLSPKADDYLRYTLYKWYLLTQCGYDATLSFYTNYLLLYVHSDETIYNIPFRMREGKQYVCLNYHDYGSIDFEKAHFTETTLHPQGAVQAFSYKVTHLPNFKPNDYQEKAIAFEYCTNDYQFKIKLNTQVKNIFANYPVVGYEAYFNIPLSSGTYGSLIPALKKHIGNMGTKEGVEYLMRFTRYAFIYKPDVEVFGGEKRFSPEQTLLYDYSDCDDRAALFFYLVKELYNLPMIVMEFDRHVTIAVGFDKAYGKSISYAGKNYSVCEPSPQKEDLKIGQLLPSLKHNSYTIAYVYTPKK